MPDMAVLAVQIAVILCACFAVATVFHWMGQPKVIAEMFAGVMLGPSLLGWMAPQLSATIFPSSSLGYLNALSQLGIVIYMFLVGLAMNPSELREHRQTTVLVSLVGIVAPFVLGMAIAAALYPRFSGSGIPFTSFALFVGAAMSITAFPVLARILASRNIAGTTIGSLALACAAVNDVVGWSILAAIVWLMDRAQAGAPPLWITLAGLPAFVVLMLTIGRRLMRRFETIHARTGRLSESILGAMLVVVLLSAVVTERLGLHLLFGAFLAGVVLPKDTTFVRHILDRFETMTVVILLPLYFAFTGLRTSVQLINGSGAWTICAAVIAIAVAGKFGGSMLAARITGRTWRESASLGALMNTRGLMELVILNIGLDAGVISPTLYSMMVIMALVTTFMTVPVFEWINARDRRALRGDPQTVTAGY